MPNETRQTIELFARSLPPALKGAVESVPLAEIIFDIGRKNGLAIDKIGKLADEVMDFILGISGPEDFADKLLIAIDSDRSKAAAVAREINRRIFAAIRDNLKKATTRGEASPAAGAAEVAKTTPPAPTLAETKKIEREALTKEIVLKAVPAAPPARSVSPPAEPAAKKPEPLILTPLGAKPGNVSRPQEEVFKGAETRPSVAEIKPKPPEMFILSPSRIPRGSTAGMNPPTTNGGRVKGGFEPFSRGIIPREKVGGFMAPQKPEVMLAGPKLPEARIPEKEVGRAEAPPKDAGVLSHQPFGPKPTIGELRNALLAKAEAARASASSMERQESPRLSGGPISKEELAKEIETIKLEQGATVRERMTDNSKRGLANKWTGGRRIESGEPETKPEKAPEAGLPKAGVAPERAMPPSVSPSSPPASPPIKQSDRVAPPVLPLRLPQQKIPKPEAPEKYEADPYRESVE